jgi:hypothetical protein
LVSRFEKTELNERRMEQTKFEETLEFAGVLFLKMTVITWKCRLNGGAKE